MVEGSQVTHEHNMSHKVHKNIVNIWPVKCIESLLLIS